MARWLISDDTFYWFISFAGELVSDPEFDISYREEINLWPCRKCGAMVMGAMRNQHKKFHEKYPMEAAGDM